MALYFNNQVICGFCNFDRVSLVGVRKHDSFLSTCRELYQISIKLNTFQVDLEGNPSIRRRISHLMSIGGAFNLPSASGPASSPHAKLVNIAGDFVDLPALQSFAEYLVAFFSGAKLDLVEIVVDCSRLAGWAKAVKQPSKDSWNRGEIYQGSGWNSDRVFRSFKREVADDHEIAGLAFGVVFFIDYPNV